MPKIRIIGGRYKNRRIPVPEAEGLRPTPERARETLFNWLQFEMNGIRVLDAFAGSGALGLEALSRGAAEVVFVDQHRPALAAIEKLCRDWGVSGAQFCCQDARQYQSSQPFHLLLLDPPFGADLLPAALAQLLPLLAPSGRVYIESPAPLREGEALPPEWQPLKQSRAGLVHFSLWGRR